jgi:hypothetical protein
VLGGYACIDGNAVGAFSAIRCVGYLPRMPLVQVRGVLMQSSRTVVRLGGAAMYLGGAPEPVCNVCHVTLPGAMSRSRCSRRETMRPRAVAGKQAAEGRVAPGYPHRTLRKRAFPDRERPCVQLEGLM